MIIIFYNSIHPHLTVQINLYNITVSTIVKLDPNVGKYYHQT